MILLKFLGLCLYVVGTIGEVLVDRVCVKWCMFSNDAVVDVISKVKSH